MNYDKPNAPTFISVEFITPHDASGPRKLVESSADAIKACKFTSGVYVVCNGGVAQYIGYSASGFSKRFLKGIAAGRETGYRWPIANNRAKVLVWELPVNSDFAEAVECELAMMLRMTSGCWPLELGGLSPKARQRGDMLTNNAVHWAYLMLKDLVKQNCIGIASNELELIEHFMKYEIRRNPMVYTD